MSDWGRGQGEVRTILHDMRFQGFFLVSLAILFLPSAPHLVRFCCSARAHACTHLCRNTGLSCGSRHRYTDRGAEAWRAGARRESHSCGRRSRLGFPRVAVRAWIQAPLYWPTGARTRSLGTTPLWMLIRTRLLLIPLDTILRILRVWELLFRDENSGTSARPARHASRLGEEDG